MDEESKNLLKTVGLHFNNLSDLDGLLIERDILLSDNKYDEVKDDITQLKKTYKSSSMTCLQTNADKNQIWPLLNLVRQILNRHGYKMEPIRKANGYTLDGVKKYKRFFKINKKSESSLSKNNDSNKSKNKNKTITTIIKKDEIEDEEENEITI